MIKALIIDDEPLARSIVQEYLMQHPDIEVLQECNDGFDGLKAIQLHKPDLIFLDVQMPKINGFEMLELVEQPLDVIFTTAFDEYAIKAFEANAIDYLLKPFSKERFEKAIQKWSSNKNSKTVEQTGGVAPETFSNIQLPDAQRIFVKKNNNIRIIPIQELLYIEAYDDYVKIHTADDTFLKKKTMQHFEQMLDPQQYVRIHRSFILQVSQITRLEPMEKESYVAVLKNNTRLPLSKSGYVKLKSVLGM
mgnify:CR=1 FL=1